MTGTSPRPFQDIVTYALDYLAELAWSIFPVCTPIIGRAGYCLQHGACAHPGKRPLVKWGVYQDELATADEIRVWWRRWPSANIGMATGELSGVVAIDLDGELAQAEAVRRGYDPGPWSRTGRVGGRHLYFQYRPDAPTIFAKLGGIDFRGQGGFLILPPSLHPSGAHYTWAERPVRGDPLPVLPRWIDEFARTGHDGPGKDPVDFERLFLDGVREGQRDQELFRAAAKMRGMDFPYDLAVVTIQELGARAKPPFPADEAKRKVDSAYGRYQPNPSVTPQPSARPAGHGVEIFDVADLQTKVLPEPRFAVPGLFPEGVVLFVGKSKLGKSWFALDVALAVSTGARAWGSIPVEQGEVLYLALEDSERRLSDRIAQIYGSPIKPATFLYALKFPRADEGGLDTVLAWLDEHPRARLVVIDVLGKFRPREANIRRLYDMDYDAIAPIADVARQRGVCVLVLHHTNKLQPDDPIDSVSGTTGLAGAADAICVFRRERGKDLAALLLTGRDIEEQELAFKFALEEHNGYAWKLVGDAAEVRMSAERQEIAAVITQQPGVTPSEIAAALGRSPANIRHMLFKMARDDQVRIYDGHYFPVLPSIPGNSRNAVTSEMEKIQNGVTQGVTTLPDTPATASTASTAITGVASRDASEHEGVTIEPLATWTWQAELCPKHQQRWADHDCDAL